ncbi:MAG TPA: aminotransferase class V-fold PLP-dependent enzyme, partial [Solirubrobacteraceae bacterium]|nr:aminotransferase class V-fold PLP-dependent enzyme [Solirubrobacteraceae bacterium]
PQTPAPTAAHALAARSRANVVRDGALAQRGERAHRVLASRNQRLARRLARVRDHRLPRHRARAVGTYTRPRLRAENRALRRKLHRLAGTSTGAGGAASPRLQAIAACESGGDPQSIGGGGTFRGKYQFTYGTWASVGGTGDPAAAAEAEQDKRAQMLLERSGSSPWPVCGSRPGGAGARLHCRVVDAAQLRAAFPVCATRAYLNAGTDGPLAAAAVAAARAELDDELASGRFRTHFERRQALRVQLRERYAARLGARPEDVAITSSTSEGVARAVNGLGLRTGDVVVTSEDEHPGLYGPLAAARDQRGAQLRVVPWDELPDAVEADVRLVASSHVNWVDGRVMPDGLAARCGEARVPLLLDGAQGVGAVPVAVEELGCAVYSGSGQKWLCGPDGTGMLWVDPAFRDHVAMTEPGYQSLADPHDPLNGGLHADARRYDGPGLSREDSAFAIAAHDVLDDDGFDAVHERARTLAATLARELAERGHEVCPRGETTLVSWRTNGDSEAVRDRLMGEGIVIRDLPGRGILRASVGAWNDESDLERLLDAL